MINQSVYQPFHDGTLNGSHATGSPLVDSSGMPIADAHRKLHSDIFVPFYKQCNIFVREFDLEHRNCPLARRIHSYLQGSVGQTSAQAATRRLSMQLSKLTTAVCLVACPRFALEACRQKVYS